MADPDVLLASVTEAFDALREAGDPYGGLLPSMLHRDSGEIYREIPGRIQVQRIPDRSYYGSNLMYDVPLLHAMYGVAAAGGGDRHADTADRYVERFADHCTDTATGIFPWGDHAYWHLLEDRLGNSGEFHDRGYPDIGGDGVVHDHFRKVPPWLWERLHDADPDRVQRFADGLDYHWISELRQAYDRHAYISTRDRKKWDPTDSANDFPRHSGLFVLDLSMAYTFEARIETREQIERFLDYWWDRRPDIPWWDEQHVLPAQAYEREAIGPSRNQTRSVAISFLEAADVLDGPAPDLAATARRRGQTYLDGVLEANAADEDDASAPTIPGDRWGAGGPYGPSPVAATALQYVAAWRAGGDERALTRARSLGRQYLDAEPPADGLFAFEDSGISVGRSVSDYVDPDEPVPISAKDAGLVLELMADLYAVTDERRWLDRGLELAETYHGIYFDEHSLPRGAAGIDWYESELGTGTLLHALVRIALLARDDADPVGPNDIQR